MGLTVQPLAQKTILNQSAPVKQPTINGVITATPGSNGFLGLTQPSAPQTLSANTAAAPASSPYTGATATADRSANDADAAAYRDQIAALNQLLSQTDIQRANGERGINQGFNSANTQLNDSRNRTLSQYGTQRQDAQTDYGRQNQQINSNARTGFGSLQALLAGTGSAGNVLAPFAVSQQANREKAGSADAYARNTRNLDTAETDAVQQFDTKRKTLEGEKNSKLESLYSTINTQKMQYLQQLGAAENQLRIAQGGTYATPTAQNNAIAALLAEQNNLPNQFAQPAYTAQTVDAKPVSLAQYEAQAAQLGGLDNSGATTDDPAAALAAFLREQQDQSNTYAY